MDTINRNISLFLLVFIVSFTFGLNASAKEDFIRVVVFPPVYKQMTDGSYVQKLRLWLGEEDFSLFKRKVMTSLVGPIMQLEDRKLTIQEEVQILERSKWFFLDSLENKMFSLRVSGAAPALFRTNRYGHTSIETPITAFNVNDAPINVSIIMGNDEIKAFSPPPITISNSGISVISDIDDTLRVSNVLSKSALARSTFLDPFVPTSQMPQMLDEYKNAGASFHYVSASPWQIWPSLQQFMLKYYPSGEMHFRNFTTDLKEKNFYDFLFGSSAPYKINAIENIISEYPGHRFVLIGDTGECDPEIYGYIANRHENRIEKIILRKVANTNFSIQRFDATLSDANLQKLQLVGQTNSLGSISCKDKT